MPNTSTFWIFCIAPATVLLVSCLFDTLLSRYRYALRHSQLLRKSCALKGYACRRSQWTSYIHTAFSQQQRLLIFYFTILTKSSEKRQVAFNWGSETIRGVNIGGWLVLEPYVISPAEVRNTEDCIGGSRLPCSTKSIKTVLRETSSTSTQ